MSCPFLFLLFFFICVCVLLLFVCLLYDIGRCLVLKDIPIKAGALYGHAALFSLASLFLLDRAQPTATEKRPCFS